MLSIVKRFLKPKKWAESVCSLLTGSTDPRLPVELERIIFELAACNDRRGIPTLMCVAPRVKQWLEPILYEIIIYNHYLYKPPGRSRISVNGKFVRHLLLKDEISLDLALDYLHSCPNLHTLSIILDASFLTTCNPTPTTDVVKFPVYQHLTHLEFKSTSPFNSRFKFIDFLSSLPNLTHLLIMTRQTNFNRDAINSIFASCLKIRVVLWFSWEIWSGFPDYNPYDADDPTREQVKIEVEGPEPRLVLGRFRDEHEHTNHFIAHATRSSHTWKKAEEIVNKRL